MIQTNLGIGGNRSRAAWILSNKDVVMQVKHGKQTPQIIDFEKEKKVQKIMLFLRTLSLEELSYLQEGFEVIEKQN